MILREHIRSFNDLARPDELAHVREQLNEMGLIYAKRQDCFVLVIENWTFASHFLSDG